ncbi:MAG TPA: nitrate- and nitrite sensing domain-containing protein [Trebonia sp.]|nr:nitrate- and nitrite sensing domain-containing protein [Trebonia sp.]
MRWRVLALVVIPTVAAIVLGAVRIEAARTTAANFARVNELAVLSDDVTALTQAVEDERDLTAGVIAARQAGDTALGDALSRELPAMYTMSDADFATVKNTAGQIGPALSGAASTDLASAIDTVSALPDLRSFVNSRMTPLPMTENYGNMVSKLLAFDNDIALGSSNAQLSASVSAFASLAQLEDQVSAQRAILYAALLEGKFEPGGVNSLSAAQSSEASDLAAFQATAANLPAYQLAANGAPAGFSATTNQAEQFNVVTQSPQIDATQATELEAIISGSTGNNLAGGTQLTQTQLAQTWDVNMTSKLSAIRGIESDDLTGIRAQAESLYQGAVGSERLTAVIVFVLLLLVLTATVVVAQSVIRPLRRLRADALDVASRRLPDMVRRLSASQEAPESIELEPIGIDSTDEIGEVARAFDQVHGEAVRLAAEEAMLRANLNAMFVNLSRRSQTLIERQLGIIESLEQSEQDEGRLSSLFRLDHLATRMRRNSENLLVLAGHEAPRKWMQPVTLVDVLRAALSEIEQYDRITLNVQSGLLIAGRAAADVVHLAAELVENATTFSRKDSQVHVSGQLLVSGGVLIEVTDEGLGIPEQELAHANWRLDNPPVIDVAVSRRMGLFVVGRLAARHGIKVRLRRAQSGGLSALIWVPETVAETEPASAPGTRRRFGTGGSPVVITSPAPAGAGLKTPALGARTTARGKSIWFDTGDEDTGLAVNLERELELEPPVAIPVAAPPAGPEPAAAAESPADAADGVPVRLPIYDSVESEWFRRGNTSFNGTGRSPSGPSWTSPADEGFRRAAETIASPVSGQLTGAGLPKRVPSANLVPGSIGIRPAGQRPAQAPAPAQADQASRSPEAVRARLTGFQLRGREGRTGGRQPATDAN